MALGSGYMAIAGVSGLMRGIAEGMQQKRYKAKSQTKEKTGNQFIEKIMSKWAESDDPQKMRAAVDYMKEAGHDPSLSLMRPETAQDIKTSGQPQQMTPEYLSQFPELTQPEPEYNLFENLQKFKDEQLAKEKVQTGEELTTAKVATEKAKTGSQKALAQQRRAKTKELLRKPIEKPADKNKEKTIRLQALKAQAKLIKEQLDGYTTTDEEGDTYNMPDPYDPEVRLLRKRLGEIETATGELSGVPRPEPEQVGPPSPTPKAKGGIDWEFFGGEKIN